MFVEWFVIVLLSLDMDGEGEGEGGKRVIGIAP